MIALGIDGGGTSTRACLMDSGRILGTGKAGPSSVDSTETLKSEASIAEAVDRAFEASGLGPKERRVASVLAGLGGIVSQTESEPLEAFLKRQPWAMEGMKAMVVNDMKIALAGGTMFQPGIVCIMGTGSVAYGRNAEGMEHKTGGWGYREGDPGSAYDLGISAIRALVRAGDGRLKETPFTEAVFSRLELRNYDDITTLLYRQNMTRAQIASLAPLVTSWADRNDPNALTIVKRAAGETALMIGTVFDRLFSSGSDSVPVAMVGSLANAEGTLHELLREELRRRSPRMVMRPALLPPVVGAALWACKNADPEFDLSSFDPLNIDPNLI